MFQWRIYVRSVDADGKENVVDRSFSDRGEFENFAATETRMPSFDRMFRDFGSRFGLADFATAIGLLGGPFPERSNAPAWTLPETVDLSKYRDASERLKKAERERAERKKSLEKALEELRGYEKTLSGDEAMLKEIRSDIKKVEKELAELK